VRWFAAIGHAADTWTDPLSGQPARGFSFPQLPLAHHRFIPSDPVQRLAQQRPGIRQPIDGILQGVQVAGVLRENLRRPRLGFRLRPVEQALEVLRQHGFLFTILGGAVAVVGLVFAFYKAGLIANKLHQRAGMRKESLSLSRSCVGSGRFIMKNRCRRGIILIAGDRETLHGFSATGAARTTLP
jgi:hypothetical protein